MSIAQNKSHRSAPYVATNLTTGERFFVFAPDPFIALARAREWESSEPLWVELWEPTHATQAHHGHP